jgi:hypothetical protein
MLPKQVKINVPSFSFKIIIIIIKKKIKNEIKILLRRHTFIHKDCLTSRSSQFSFFLDFFSFGVIHKDAFH